ncbi:MAG: amino-acid N-acetyltransferase [Methylococcales bacterium]|jgi:amino-acid N-acetyltransferase|nr:amino-acid N-acetyltransferase [Methylococcales bacterium]
MNNFKKIMPYVQWFRTAAPYINNHRDNTFVVVFNSDQIKTRQFSNFIHDITLLDSLGVHLVLIFCIQNDIKKKLASLNIKQEYQQEIPIITQQQLVHIKELIGSVKIEMESIFSMGLANSPMAGADILTTSGNFITAQPRGIVNGVDLGHSGIIRNINQTGINQHLTNNHIVIIPTLGYSPTGETFFLDTHELASQTAIQLKADKLIFLTEHPDFFSENKLMTRLTLTEAKQLLIGASTEKNHLNSAITCSEQGVKRTHIIDQNINGGLLVELFTREGIGTLITSEPHKETYQAKIDDVGGILKLITPLEEQGVLVKRSRDHLETEIKNYYVIKIDGLIIACAAFYPFTQNSVAELACLAIHPEYRNKGYGNHLLKHIEKTAKLLHIQQLFVLTTQTEHWFRERGFETSEIDQLPIEKQQLYNYQRQSKIFLKKL